MELERQKSILLATAIKEFIDLVNKDENSRNALISHSEKLLRLKLIVEEYRLGTIADELLRVNNHTWDEQASRILIDRFISTFKHIAEYVENNQTDLFMYSGRIYTLEHYCRLASA